MPYQIHGIAGRLQFLVQSPSAGLPGMITFTGVQGFHGTELTVCELFRISCKDGSVALFTPHPESVEVAGHGTYQPIPIKRSEINFHPDLQVDKVTVDLGIVGIQVGSKQLTIPQIIHREYLRDAYVEIFAYDYEAGTVLRTLFEGDVRSDVTCNQGVVSIPVSSVLDRLKEVVPKLIWSEYCQHQLYSSRNTYDCHVDRGAFAEAGVVTEATGRMIRAAVFASANKALGWWAKGYLTFTSGDNIDLSRTIYSHGEGYINLLTPFPDAVAVGDTFTVYAGCDRTGATCQTKFNNYANFFGFEYIPKSEVLYG